MTGGFPHMHLGLNAGAEPDREPQPYRITIHLRAVSEAEGVAVASEIADVLAARAIAIRGDDKTVRSMIALDACPWPDRFGEASLHLIVPKAVPRAPDLAQDYSPN